MIGHELLSHSRSQAVASDKNIGDIVAQHIGVDGGDELRKQGIVSTLADPVMFFASVLGGGPVRVVPRGAVFRASEGPRSWNLPWFFLFLSDC